MPPEWKPYFNGRKKLDHPAGFVLIVPEDYQRPIPIFCPLCHMALRSLDDPAYWEKYGCCSRCGIKWADPNRDRWAAGWRPTPVEVSEEVRIRKEFPLNLDLSAFEDGSG